MHTRTKTFSLMLACWGVFWPQVVQIIRMLSLVLLTIQMTLLSTEPVLKAHTCIPAKKEILCREMYPCSASGSTSAAN